MNSPTITMQREAAVAKLEQYEEAARKNPNAYRDIDKGLMEGYRVLAKGGRLVDVNEAIRAGGLNLAGLPRLAISRAHAESTQFGYSWEYRHVDGDGVYSPTGGGTFEYGSTPRSRISDDRVKWVIPIDTFDRSKQSRKSVRAMCPLIPLPLRPRHALSNYFLLFEANWHPLPPIDPYLLKPLAGSLMQILAEWNLTPLEIAAVRAATLQTR